MIVMKCQARTWMQVQVRAEEKLAHGCSREGKHVLDGHACCTHHYNNPPTFGWNE